MDYVTMTGKEIYDKLAPKREPAMDQAKLNAKVTLPSLFPEDPSQPKQRFSSPQQGIGARGLTNLSAHMLLTFFPTQTELIRIVPDAIAERTMREQGAEDRQAMEAALAEREIQARNVLDTRSYRVAGSEIIDQLLVAGNACEYTPAKGDLEVFTLDQYVVQFAADNKTILCLVIKEEQSLQALEEDLQDLAKMHNLAKTGTSFQTMDEDMVEIYTKVYLKHTRKGRKKYRIEQTLGDMMIPGSDYEVFEEDLPYNPIRWKRLKGTSYGEAMVTPYYEDLLKLEHLGIGTFEGALIMMQIKGLVRPSGNTDPDDLNDAENGDFIYGDEGDVSIVQVQKGADFAVPLSVEERLLQRVEEAFLLNKSASRDAERVTAFEVEHRSGDSEAKLAAIFSYLNQTWIKPMATKILKNLEKEGVVGKIHKALNDHLHVVVVAGLDSLGRAAELSKFQNIASVLQPIVGPEQLAAEVNVGNLVHFAFRAGGIRVDGLAKSDEQKQAEAAAAQAAQTQQTIVEKGTPAAAKAVAENPDLGEALQQALGG